MTESTKTVNDKYDRTAEPARGFVLSGGQSGVLLIHGFASSVAFLRTLGEYLNRQGHTVVGVKLAGHGTDIGDLERSTGDDWAASVRRGFGLFPDKVRQVTVIGESMGAFLAFGAVRECPGLIRGLVLLAPPIRQKNELARKFLSQVLPPRTRWKKSWIDEKNREAYLRAGSLLEVSPRSYREFLKVRRHELKNLSKLRLPMLAIFGDHDYATDLVSIETLKKLTFPPDQLTVKVFQGASHHLTGSAHEQAVNRIIADFVKAVNDVF